MVTEEENNLAKAQMQLTYAILSYCIILTSLLFFYDGFGQIFLASNQIKVKGYALDVECITTGCTYDVKFYDTKNRDTIIFSTYWVHDHDFNIGDSVIVYYDPVYPKYAHIEGERYFQHIVFFLILIILGWLWYEPIKYFIRRK